MAPLFDVTEVRPAASRGERSARMRRLPKDHGSWPPRDRNPHDPALVAARMLAVSGYLVTRLRRLARELGVDPMVMRFLLLFAERPHALRIQDAADALGVSHTTASRIARRAEAADLIDKLPICVDGRVVSCRLSVRGRDAVLRSLDAFRPAARSVLGTNRAAPPTDGGDDVPTALHRVLPFEPQWRPLGNHPGWRSGVRAGMPKHD